MAMGVGAYTAGLFHLMTHAYFKAMLFLGSGSVIHGMEDVVGHDTALNQDMRLMGGLRKYMPITAMTFLVGTLAISGIPPFAGFWSKDEILGSAFGANPLLWGIGWLTAGMTAFYMFRMYFRTFEGEFRGNEMDIRKQLLAGAKSSLELGSESATLSPNFGPGAMDTRELKAKAHDSHDDHSHSEYPHESPISMTLPLLILAVPSALIGLVGTPFHNYFEEFIHAPSESVEEVLEKATEFNLTEFLIMGGNSVGIALIGITLASLMYLHGKIDPAAIASRIPFLYKLSLNKWYFDEIYDNLFVQGCRRIARQVMEVDFRVVDGAVNLTGLAALLSGESLKYFETGRVQFYALIVFAAVLVGVIVFGVT
jgi:NAD(P)H-quinone oxidoreductase subunit 5